MSRKAVVAVLSAPSGAGKSTVAEKILSKTSKIQRAITHTTRAPRPGEINGEHYYFVDEAKFKQLLEDGAFVEHARVYDNDYGTSYQEIERILNQKKDILLVIESKGAKIIKQKFQQSVFVLMLPPSLEELSRRIYSRPGSQMNPKDVKARLSLAKKEVKSMKWYDYVVVNETVEETAEEVLAILDVEKKRLKNSKEFLEPFL